MGALLFCAPTSLAENSGNMLVLKRVSFCEPIYSIHILGVYQHHGRSGNYQECLRFGTPMIQAKLVQLASPAKTGSGRVKPHGCLGQDYLRSRSCAPGCDFFGHATSQPCCSFGRHGGMHEHGAPVIGACVWNCCPGRVAASCSGIYTTHMTHPRFLPSTWSRVINCMNIYVCRLWSASVSSCWFGACLWLLGGAGRA